ncbi:MAG TPA: hypothetical protein VF708_01110 [Pyrinomonadaceae bacterium]
MFRRVINKKTAFLALSLAALAILILPMSIPTSSAEGMTGQELLSVTRVAHGGSKYAQLNYVTAYSSGWVNVAAVVSTGATTVGGMIETKLTVTDYQDRDLRRRLEVAPGGLVTGPTYLVYTGTSGGGMLAGQPFRVSEINASRQWAMMGFGTLNRAVEGSLPAVRQSDQGYDYVVDVKFNPTDTVRYFIHKNSFLIDKVQTRYNGRLLVEEDRGDYRDISCMMFPFHITTKLSGQRLAELTIDRYDLQTAVQPTIFILPGE